MVTGPYCAGCANASAGIRRLEPTGDGSSGILVVGDSPWKDEIAAGYQFAGAAGDYLNRQLDRLKIKRSSLAVTNALGCRPPHLGWTDHPARYPEALNALAQCAPYLADTVRRYQPKVILALGNVALRQVTGVEGGMDERHSYVHETGFGIPAIPTYHPSHIMQGKQKLTACLLFAMRRAQEIADGRYKQDSYELLLDPGPAAAMEYLNKAGATIPLLFVDIETPESGRLDEEELEDKGISYHILRAGFSYRDGTGISFPFEGDYIRVMAEALRRAEIVAEWADNHFDTKRLAAAGLSIPGKVISGMWAWHFLQSDLLKGLGFVAPFFYAGPPWKHLATVNQAFYNAMDQVVGRACTVGSMEALRREGRLDAFMRHCVDADPILIRMGGMGVKIAGGKQSSFIGRLRGEYASKVMEVQSAAPVEVCKVKRWKRKPKRIDNGWANVVISNKYKELVQIVEDAEGGCHATLPFNLNSPPQVKALIQHFGLKVPRMRGEDRDTTGAKYLKRFGVKYPIFRAIVEAKERGKIISSYDWKLDDRGRVRTTYGYHPSTWRKSSRNVNLQVIPKRNDLAAEFREMMVADDGHVLIEGDSAAIEAVLVGYWAKSDRYINLARAGVHDWLASQMVKEPIDWALPLPQLAAACKDIKRRHPVAREAAKRCIHASNYLLSPYGMYDEYQEYFPTEKDAKVMQDLYFSLPPGQDVRRWQAATMEEAHERRALTNSYQYKHYFYSVFKWNKKRREWEPDHDGDAKRAVAFRPQSDASGFQTEVLLRLAAVEEMLSYLRLIIHDSIVLEVPLARADWAAALLAAEMTRPSAAHGGLVIGAEVKVGCNLRYMEEVKYG